MADLRRRNNVNVSGRGEQPMVFAHGFGCDQNMWGYAAPAFGDDFEVVLFDHGGAGGSDVSAYDPAGYGSLWSTCGMCWRPATRSRLFGLSSAAE